MHVKPSGVIILLSAIALAIVAIVAGWRVLPVPGVVADPNQIVLPDYLAQKTNDRYPVYTDRLASAWSRKTRLATNYGPEVLPLEDGAIAEVRCNGENGQLYSVDSLGRVFKNGIQVYDTSKWPVCYFLEVHAATPESIGKAYVVSLVKMK